MTQWTTMTPEAHADWLAAYPRPYSGRMNLESEPRRIEQYDDALGTGEAGLISYGVQGPGGAVSEFAVRSSLIRVDAEHEAVVAVRALIAERDALGASRDGFERMFMEANADMHAATTRAEAAEARVAELEAVLNRAQAALIAGVPG